MPEFAPRVKYRHHHFQRGFLLFRMDVHRDTASIVYDGNAAVRMDDDFDTAAFAHEGFIDGIIDHLVYKMMKRLKIGTAHVHARPAAYCLQTFEYLDILSAITGGFIVAQLMYLHLPAFSWHLSSFEYCIASTLNHPGSTENWLPVAL